MKLLNSISTQATLAIIIIIIIIDTATRVQILDEIDCIFTLH